MKTTAPLSAVVATRNRTNSLRQTLDSLLRQEVFPRELIVIDASDDEATKDLITGFGQQISGLATACWLQAEICGAAAQRNQGVSIATEPFIWFFDDDIRFEPSCVERLWRAIESDRKLGGANAMITNQSYHTPGAVSRLIFRLMNGKSEPSYAGRVIGPAINLLPEDRHELPEVVPVEWLNTTCTMYRREALPDPPFPAQFTGYSLMEDIALSLQVSKKWKLANARTARIFHDSQPADYKSDQRLLSRMLVRNRFFVMTQIMNKRAVSDHLRFLVWELFQLLSVSARPETRGKAVAMLLGQIEGYAQVLTGRTRT